MPRTTGTYATTTTLGESVRAFVPRPLPPADPPLEPTCFVDLNRQAELALARLAGVSGLVPSVEWLLYSAIRKEALLTSQIEGTQATLTDLFDDEAGLKVSNTDDVEEVTNYLRAFRWVQGQLRDPQGLPISVRLLCEAHRLLLDGARGPGKQPGELRRSQNWIGGTRPGNAAFVPPPPEQVTTLLADLERFIHDAHQGQAALPPLVRVALVHAQFETIHPFLDGNGRTGRLLITLYLMHANLLSTPTLYLSAFLDAHRDDYFDALNRVRTKDDMDFWLLFFLAGVTETAKDARKTLTSITELKKRYEELITSAFGKRTVVALRFLHYLFSHPMVQVKDATETLGITKPSANSLVAQFVDVGILKRTTDKKRDRIFSLWEYVGLFDSQIQ